MNQTEKLLDEVQELVWALVDDQATEADVCRLEQLLLENDEARRTYVMCMQMHADLYFLLNDRCRKLPERLLKIIQASQQSTSQAAKPLPLVDMPTGSSGIPLSNGCL